MGYVVYYAVSIVFHIVALYLLRAHINLTATSAIPLFLLGLSAFQAVYFCKNRSKQDFNANSTTDLSDREWETLSVYTSRSYRICIPFFLPPIFFFSTLFKTLLSTFLFLIAFTGGAIFFRLHHGSSFQARMKQEMDELEEQMKRESLGKYK